MTTYKSKPTRRMDKSWFHGVYIIESESGWGSRVDEIRYYETKDEALTFINEFNSKNTSAVVPDWYMRAEYQYSEV